MIETRYAEHPDDAALARFTGAMRKELARMRETDGAGWRYSGLTALWTKLRDAAKDGRPAQIACLAMMIWTKRREIGKDA